MKYTCQTCPSRYTTNDPSNFRRHMTQSVSHARKVLGLGPVVRVWKCEPCQTEFGRSDHMKLHVATAKHKRNVVWRRRRTVRAHHRQQRRDLKAAGARDESAAARGAQRPPEPSVAGLDVSAVVAARIERDKAHRAAALNRTMIRPFRPFPRFQRGVVETKTQEVLPAQPRAAKVCGPSAGDFKSTKSGLPHDSVRTRSTRPPTSRKS